MKSKICLKRIFPCFNTQQKKIQIKKKSQHQHFDHKIDFKTKPTTTKESAFQ